MCLVLYVFRGAYHMSQARGDPAHKKSATAREPSRRTRKPQTPRCVEQGVAAFGAATEEATKFKRLWPCTRLRDGCQSVQARSDLDRPAHQFAPAGERGVEPCLEPPFDAHEFIARHPGFAGFE